MSVQKEGQLRHVCTEGSSVKGWLYRRKVSLGMAVQKEGQLRHGCTEGSSVKAWMYRRKVS